MWLPLGIAYVAGLSVVDFTLFNYIGFYTGISDLMFGVVGAAWSAIFILSSELLGRAADRGSYRPLATISLASVAAMLALLAVSRSLPFLVAAYMAHALAVSSANLSLSSGIFELEDYKRWDADVQSQRLGLYSIRGLSLLALSLVAPAAVLSRAILIIVAVVGAASAAYTFLLPSASAYGVFRRLYRVDRSLALFSPYMASLGAFVVGRGDVTVAVARSAVRAGRSRPMAAAISAMAATFIGDYLLTALPLMLRGGELGFGDYALAFGASALLAAAALLFITSGLGSSKWGLSAFLTLRAAWLLAGLELIGMGLWGLVAYVVGYVVLYALIDIGLYTYYYASSGGYGVHYYMILRELGSLAGSAAAGAALEAGWAPFMAVPSVMAAVSVASLTMS